MPLSQAGINRMVRRHRDYATWPCPEPDRGVVHNVFWGQLNRTLCPTAVNLYELRRKLGQNQLTGQPDRVTCASCRAIRTMMEGLVEETGGTVKMDAAIWAKIDEIYAELGTGEEHDLDH